MQIETHGPEIPVVPLADGVVTTERSHDLKFDNGSINIVYFYTGSYKKMGNLSKSKASFICTICTLVQIYSRV